MADDEKKKLLADYALVIRRSYVCDMLRGGMVLGKVSELSEIVGTMKAEGARA